MAVIERFEESYCIIELEDGSHLSVKRSLLPPDAKEGDFVVRSKDAYIVDREKTAALREEILKLQNDLWE